MIPNTPPTDSGITVGQLTSRKAFGASCTFVAIIKKRIAGIAALGPTITARIGAIVRKNKVIIPRSNFIFEKDDLVVFLAKREQLKAVENIFSVGSI